MTFAPRQPTPRQGSEHTPHRHSSSPQSAAVSQGCRYTDSESLSSAQPHTTRTALTNRGWETCLHRDRPALTLLMAIATGRGRANDTVIMAEPTALCHALGTTPAKRFRE